MRYLYIEELELYLANRFLSKGTTKIHYTLKHDMQLILGVNGFGKSSLLEELSPLPAKATNYRTGGYKKIKLTCDQNNYTLISDFTKGNHHEFYKDGVNLNQGRTYKVQLALVQEHLGYTIEIHNLLLGKVSLSRLSPDARRQLFTQICPTNIDLAIKVYDQARTKYRDNQGALKVQAGEITKYTNLVKQAEDENTTTQLQALTAKLNGYLEYLHQNVEWSEHHQYELDRLTVEVDQLAIDILKLDRTDKRLTLQIPELERTINETNKTISGLSGEYTGLLQLYDSLSARIDKHKALDSLSLDDLKAQYTELDTQANQYVADIPSMYFDIPAPAQTLVNFESYRSELEHGLKELYRLAPEGVTMATIRETQQRRHELSGKHTGLVIRLERAKGKYEQLRAHDPVQCEKCNHRWIPGVSDELLSKITVFIEKATPALTTYETELKQTDTLLATYSEWMAIRSKIADRMSALGLNAVVAEWEDYTAFANPLTLVRSLDTVAEHLASVAQYHNAVRERDKIKVVYDTKVELSKDSDLEDMLAERTRIERALADISARSINYKQNLKELNQTLQYIQNLKERIAHFDTLRKRFNDKLDYKLKHLVNEQVYTIIDPISQEIQQLEAKLYERNRISDMLKTLQELEHTLQQNQQALDALIDILSPTTGLIGETLYNFIQNVIGYMNDIIKNIWNTKFEIFIEIPESGNFDYRFKVKMLGDTPASDIKECSDGEVELVDFAFVLAARRYLGLEHYPSYFDEVGREFHESHRIRLFEYLKALHETERVRQMFVISHFPQIHGTLVNAQWNVLDPSGLTVPPQANQHLVLA